MRLLRILRAALYLHERRVRALSAEQRHEYNLHVSRLAWR